MTREVQIGKLKLGGGNPILVQSMTNTDTRDVNATLDQIRRLAEAGCDLVRVSVYDQACAEAVRPLTDGSPVPLVADIHFDYRLAIQAMENGISKMRIRERRLGIVNILPLNSVFIFLIPSYPCNFKDACLTEIHVVPRRPELSPSRDHSISFCG